MREVYKFCKNVLMDICKCTADLYQSIRGVRHELISVYARKSWEVRYFDPGYAEAG